MEIPEDQLDRVVELGQISFRPGPGKEIATFAAGRERRRSSLLVEDAPGGRPKHPAATHGASGSG